MKVRPVSLWSCAYVRVPWDRAEGTYTERRLLQSLNLSGCRVQYSVSLGTGSLGLRDRSAIPASVQGPVWLSAIELACV
jgi:hypothetical protein